MLADSVVLWNRASVDSDIGLGFHSAWVLCVLDFFRHAADCDRDHLMVRIGFGASHRHRNHAHHCDYVCRDGHGDVRAYTCQVLNDNGRALPG